MKLRIESFLITCVVLWLLAATGAFAQAPLVEKVEPPNWWADHSINPVRLLVRGRNFDAENPEQIRVEATRPETVPGKVRVNDTGTYLFVDVEIRSGASPGSYPLKLTTKGGSVLIPFEISARSPRLRPGRGLSNDDVIYLIMPDRFANGNTDNDRPGGTTEFANDRKNSRAWHGGDFAGITKRVPYLKELGVTAVWLTPWYDNPDNEVNCDKPWCPNTNYHGYHAIDYYSVENRFGTMRDLREMVEECHRNGIKVIQDQVANHVGHVHPWMKTRPLGNWFSEFSPNTFNNSILLSPNASPKERNDLLRGWFNELLPDLNHSEPEVVRYEIQNALWWIEMASIDGIRQDTIQYMPREFIRDWSEAILKEYPDFWMVGEIFERDSAQTAFFQGGKEGWDGVDTKLPAVFDFNLWHTAQKVFTGKAPMRSLRDVLKYDGLYPDIDNVVFLANNHDTVRFMSLEGANIERAKLFTAFVMSTRGIPQIYYGEEILMTGGHDPDNRKDFPGGWATDKADKFEKAGRTFKEEEMFEWTRDWIALRKNHPAIKKGRTVDLHYDDDSYVYARVLDDQAFVFSFARGEKKTKDLDLKNLGLGGSLTVTQIILGTPEEQPTLMWDGATGLKAGGSSLGVYHVVKNSPK